jgi:tetratricopeptide (TPR) repeat protein
MNQCGSIGLLAIVLASSLIAPSAAQPQNADAGWAACVTAPNRACMLDEAMVVARIITSDRERVDPLLSIAKVQAASGRSAEAEPTIAEAMRVLNVAGGDARWRANALGAIAAAQAKAGLTAEAGATIGQALQLFDSITDATEASRDYDLVSIARGQAEAGNLAEALRVARTVKGEWRRAEAIGFAARGRAQAGDFAGAVLLAQAIARWDTGEVLQSIAEAQMTAGLEEEATDTLVAAAGLAQSHAHRTLDVYKPVAILLSIAASQAKAGLTSDARDTFGRALQVAQSIEMSIGMAPPPIVERIEAIITVAEAEARAGMSDAAKAAFEQALGLTGEIEQSQWGTFAPNDITTERRQWRTHSLAALAAGQARAGLTTDATITIEQAMPLAQSLDERSGLFYPGRAEVLSLIASAQAHVGNFAAAAHIVPLIGDGYYRARAVAAIAEVGQVDEALRLAPSVEDERDRGMMLAAMVPQLSNRDELARAEAIAATIKHPHWRVHALGPVARMQAKAGQFREAATTIGKVAAIATSIEPGLGRDQTLGQVIDQLCAVAEALPN